MRLKRLYKAILISFFALWLPFLPALLLGEEGDNPSALQNEQKKQQEDNSSQEVQQKLTSELNIKAGHMEQIDKEHRLASDYVVISYQDILLHADKTTYNILTLEFIAEGNAVLEQKDMKIAGDKMEFNMKTGTGTFHNARLTVKDEFIIEAEKIEKIGEDKFRVNNVVFTSCTQPTPHWSVSCGEATIHIDHYITLRGPTLKIKNIPVFYFPYLKWPLKRERSTGFLLPNIGSSTLRGMIVSNAFFWAINRSMDATFFLDYNSKLGWGRGAQYRYVLDERSQGNAYGYYLTDKDTGSKRYNFKLFHNQKMGAGFRAGASVDYLSDLAFRQDFERDFSVTSSRSIRSWGFLNWSRSYYSFSLQVSEHQTHFIRSDQDGELQTDEVTRSYVTMRDLPSVTLSGRSQRLGGSPFYFSFETSFLKPNRIEFKKGIEKETSYSRRIDLYPQISAPFTGLKWLTITPSFGFRETIYDKQKDPVSEQLQILDSTLHRRYYQFAVSIIGPVFTKIFDTPDNSYSPKFKHIIEPRISYNYISEVTNQDRVILYDATDFSFPFNELRFSLINRFLAKRRDPSTGQLVPWEFLTLEVSQFYSLDPALGTSFGRNYNRLRGVVTGTTEIHALSPLQTRVTFSPHPQYQISTRLIYNLYQRDFQSVGINSYFQHKDRIGLNASYYRSLPIEDGIIPGHIVGTNGWFNLQKKRWEFTYSFNYNFQLHRLLQGGAGVKYNTQCCGFLFKFTRFDFFYRQVTEFRIMVDLKNIGSLANFF